MKDEKNESGNYMEAYSEIFIGNWNMEYNQEAL
jgi:hypothetical protein